jgi:hypothetical protein
MAFVSVFQRLRPYSICKLGKASITNQAMASLVKAPPTMSTINAHQVHLRKQKLLSNLNMHHGLRFPRIHVNHTTVCCTKSTPWEPSPVTYAPTIDASGNLLKKTSKHIWNLEVWRHSWSTSNQQWRAYRYKESVIGAISVSSMADVASGPFSSPDYRHGTHIMAASIFCIPWSQYTSLLSLIGLDCIFNLGATLFLLWLILVLGPKTRHKAAIASLLWVTNFGTWLQLYPVLWFPWWRYWDLKRAPSIPAACFLSWAYLFLCFKIIF